MKNASLNVKGIAAAAVLAGTMAFAPVSALATTVTAGTTAGDVALVNKTWTAASNSQLNDDETFKFQLDYVNAEQVGTLATKTPSKTTATVELSSKWLTDAKGGASATANLTAAQVFDGIDFTAPGVYHFTLKEEKGSNPNIVYSTETYDVYVTVTMPGDYPASDTPTIAAVAVRSNGNKVNTDFQNTPHANASLNVSKTVAGIAANTEDVFHYTLKIKGAEGSYDVVKSDGKTETALDKKVKADETYEFTLKHGESIEVKNLPEGATYTVTEENTDYTETNTVNGAASANGCVAEGTIAGQNTVAYRNERGFAADTGITMNVIPYVVAGGVVVAGAATLVISRHRRANEEF